MTEYRGIVIVTVVLPLSFSIELFFEFRDWFYRTFQVFQAVLLLYTNTQTRIAHY
jgi:hypothetical protein